MKLRNKKTGEIIDLDIANIKAQWGGISVIPEPVILGGDEYVYHSLAELNSEWEDYEEPKGIQCIYYASNFQGSKATGVFIGYATKEEAKKAVEKLKAWKRLKDKGFKFDGWTSDYGKLKAWFKFDKEAWLTETEPDLDLLFGGEE